ncbi:glycerol kinase GlpK [Weissella ceti]|nr:glycerol kinase GlpK [Weissella ceti]QVK12148.1 glycerol kinase GlpK [Weissella ceti]
MAIERPELILTIDQGTTGTRAALFNHNARRVATSSTSLTPIVPHAGWQEQNPLEIWGSVQTTIADALIDSGVRATEIKAIGIASQRETTLIWNRQTGQPIYNAISWASVQTKDITKKYIKAGLSELIQTRTGLPLSPYFSATKIRWILDHVDGAQEAAEAGELAFGTVDTWLTWQLTGGTVHVTDTTNASRTMLMNLETLTWDDELLELFNIPRSLLPEIHQSSEIVGETSPVQFFGTKVPIASLIGDQNASLVGQLGLSAGDVKATYGAGAFLMMNTGDEIIHSKHGLVSTIAYHVNDHPVHALEGSIFSAGTAVQWLNDQLGLIDNQVDAWRAAEKSINQDEVYVVPAFNGLGAPYWNPHAQGSALGLTLGTTKNDFIKATLQSIAYSTADILNTMCLEANIQPKALLTDGSVSRNPYLMQFQSDIADIRIDRAMDEDATALGAAFLAGRTIGFWSDIADMTHYLEKGRQFTANMPEEKRTHLLNGWHAAIQSTQAFTQED